MRVLGLLLLVPLVGGCSTSMMAATPATQGKYFVVGHHGFDHAIWVCPEQGSDVKCTEVEIKE